MSGQRRPGVLQLFRHQLRQQLPDGLQYCYLQSIWRTIQISPVSNVGDLIDELIKC